MAPWIKTMNRTKRYLDLWIQEIEASLNKLQIKYPDTYGQALAQWWMHTKTHQEEDINRKRTT